MIKKVILIILLSVSVSVAQSGLTNQIQFGFQVQSQMQFGTEKAPKLLTPFFPALRRMGSKGSEKLTDFSPKITPPSSKKSPGLAFLYSLFVPGTGQLYTKRADVGKYFLISEAALWLGFGAFTVYSNWLFNDASSYAVTHARINAVGKDNDFYVNIGNYDNVDVYNDDMLRHGNYDKIYNASNYFYWDTVEDRKKFREDHIASDRIKNDRLFIVGAVLINHIVSAISAIVLTNDYNKSQKGGGGLTLNAGVIKHFNKVDGIKLNITKRF